VDKKALCPSLGSHLFFDQRPDPPFFQTCFLFGRLRPGSQFKGDLVFFLYDLRGVFFFFPMLVFVFEHLSNVRSVQGFFYPVSINLPFLVFSFVVIFFGRCWIFPDNPRGSLFFHKVCLSCFVSSFPLFFFLFFSVSHPILSLVDKSFLLFLAHLFHFLWVFGVFRQWGCLSFLFLPCRDVFFFFFSQETLFPPFFLRGR